MRKLLDYLPDLIAPALVALLVGGGAALANFSTPPNDGTVPSGGTGRTSFTAYAPIFGGTTATGALQSGTVGTATQVLTSNGAGALPTFQAAGGPPSGAAGGVLSGTYPNPGLATLTANNVLLGNGTGAPQVVAPGTSGNVLTSDGTTWNSIAAVGCSVNCTVTSTGNNAALTLTAASKGSGQTTPILSLTGTWNDASTVFTGIRVNATSTASSATSPLIDLQIGGTSKFYVDRVGRVVAVAGTTTTSVSFGSSTTNIAPQGNGLMTISNSGATAGGTIDISTGGTAGAFQFRDAFGSALGTVEAASFKANGTAGVGCTVGTLNPVTAIVVGGIITHC